MKIKLLFLLSAITIAQACFANGIHFNENKTWKEMLALAKKEGKLIFLDAYATWCGPCKVMQRDVFTDEEVGRFYNEAFINVKMDMEKGEGITLSETYEVMAYPTLLFINGDGELVHKSVGGLDALNFIKLGIDALDPEKQFYTLKKAGNAGALSPAAFHNWVHSAEEMEENDLEEVISNYLSKTTAPLMEKEMLTLVLDHASDLTEKQIKELHTSQKKVQALTGKSKEAFDNLLLGKVIYMAIGKTYKEDGMDFAACQKIIASYYPAAAALETEKIKARYYKQTENNAECLKAITQLLSNQKLGLNAYDMAMLFVTNSDVIVSEKQSASFLRLINNYQLLPAEKNQVYYKNLALLMLYYKLADNVNMKVAAQKIIADKNAPEEIKEIAEKALE